MNPDDDGRKNVSLEVQIEQEQREALERQRKEQLQTWEARPAAPAPLRSVRALAAKGRRGEYDGDMADYLEQAVYAGVDVEVARKAIGISKARWEDWSERAKRAEEPYAELLGRVESAKHALLVRLHREIARHGDPKWKTWLIERLAGRGAAEPQSELRLVHIYESLPAEQLAARAEGLSQIARNLGGKPNGKRRDKR